ncbi:MAG: hypothetical protein HOH46_08920 [Rhodospirillaceae bacterium]|nr:hypothetical protein [Rhodospirillaceae bacterium]MBT6588322.1 hypothetical protein [Rhodospirillaceae bacterium]MBT6910058.1 hypothetical protein [Rhodospirillaceae bacterium]
MEILVKARQFELVVFAADPDDTRATELVRSARQYDKSSDPYTPMILVSWNGGSDNIREALNTGTDQLLMWPFSTTQLGARVDALVNDRKPFIETEDYMGPDRRNLEKRGGKQNSVEVPNALRAKVRQQPDLAPSREALEAARDSLERIKIANVARRISTIAKVLRQRCDDQKFMQARASRELAAVLTSLGVVREALDITELHHMHPFCTSVEQVVSQLLLDAPELDGKGLALLEQTAIALRIAMDLDEDTANAALRLSGEVARAR